MSWGLILTYLEMTSTSSCCNLGRKSGVMPLPRSLIRISCSRSFATLADVFFSPSRKERKDMSFPSEQALDQARLCVIDETQRLVFATVARSEEHTSELQSLMRIPYAVLFLKTKNHPH